MFEQEFHTASCEIKISLRVNHDSENSDINLKNSKTNLLQDVSMDLDKKSEHEINNNAIESPKQLIDGQQTTNENSIINLPTVVINSNF